MKEENEIKESLNLGEKLEVELETEDKKSKTKRFVSTTILCISCLLNIYLCNVILHSVSFNGGNFLQVQKLRLFKELISNYYYEEIKEEDLIQGCINGMVNVADDPYTVYFTKEEMERFLERTKGKYTGVGISVDVDHDGLAKIVDVYDGSSAKRVGLKIGDKILKIDGRDVTNITDEQEVIDLINGELGQEILFEVLKADTNSKVEVKLKIEDINLVEVESEVLDQDIGYIKLKVFDENVSAEFKEHLERLKEKNIKALLLDLRDNPGGDYKEVVNIANSLLPDGSLIVYTEDRSKSKEKQYAKEEGLDLPIIVLVNGNSASASEVLSGALKDNNKAWLLGTKTYGKALVQSVIQFKDGSGMKITTARYYTPSGECIQGKGIQPDYEVRLPEEYKDYLSSQIPRESDTQLIEALRIIKTKINGG